MKNFDIKDQPQANIDWLMSWRPHYVFGRARIGRGIIEYLYFFADQADIRPGVAETRKLFREEAEKLPIWDNYPNACFCHTCGGPTVQHYAYAVGLSLDTPRDAVIDKWLEEKGVDIRYWLEDE